MRDLSAASFTRRERGREKERKRETDREKERDREKKREGGGRERGKSNLSIKAPVVLLRENLHLLEGLGLRIWV